MQNVPFLSFLVASTLTLAFLPFSANKIKTEIIVLAISEIANSKSEQSEIHFCRFQ